ncbi:MAG TPA: response regulator transcription factor [Solirubrobacteraceae bacterium]
MSIDEPRGARHDVLLAAQPLVAEGLRLLVAEDARTTLAGQVDDSEKLLDALARRRPAACVLHAAVAGSAEDLNALVRSVVASRQTPLLVLDDAWEAPAVLGALEAGAAAVLDASDVRCALVSAVCAVADGLTVCGARARSALLGSLAPLATERLPQAGVEDLTPRELEVFALVGDGLSNLDVAERLMLSERTVKGHVSHLLAKLDTRDRAQLVVAAFEAGVVRTAVHDVQPAP